MIQTGPLHHLNCYNESQKVNYQKKSTSFRWFASNTNSRTQDNFLGKISEIKREKGTLIKVTFKNFFFSFIGLK